MASLDKQVQKIYLGIKDVPVTGLSGRSGA
jgi:hypothetical protein